MPSLIDGSQSSKKRKNPAKDVSREGSSKRRVVTSEESEDEEQRIETLEKQIAESQRYYNNIVTLISMLHDDRPSKQPNIPVMVSLCRIFCRLTASGKMKEPQRATEQEKILTAWLKERSHEYQDSLLTCIREADPSSQITALTLCLRLIQARSSSFPGSESQDWLSGFFSDVFEATVESENGEVLRSEFIEKFLREYDDIRYHTFWQISKYAATERSPPILDRLIAILTSCDAVPTLEHEFTKFYSDPEKKENGRKNSVLSVSSHKKRAQDAWLAVLRNRLDESQRKSLLRLMSRNIAPWFNRPELLMDFLTDSYNSGGSTSLLALSGLFYLIQEKNLDYPQFYAKLYSLLDSELLHSKHRSRFLRLMETFLSSTHLPVTLVASFIKRLARLALSAPPSAIVAIIPFIYNLLKTHPTCSFMIHRVLTPERKSEVELNGMEDPFNPDESDPTLTSAIDSSLWEIDTLQSHYHPNVAAICRIISEQFTKQAYNLEDFLDYTYQGMVAAELGVEEKTSFKKPPVVEFQIPKRIFTDRLLEEDSGHDTAPGALLRELWTFPS